MLTFASMRKTFQSYIALLMLVLLFVNVTSPITVYFSYLLNKEYIATHLCVNKDRPELACKGKCVLMQKLASLNKKDDTEKKNIPTYYALTFKYIHTPSLRVKRNSTDISKHFSKHTPSLYAYLFYTSILQPPQYIS